MLSRLFFLNKIKSLRPLYTALRIYKSTQVNEIRDSYNNDAARPHDWDLALPYDQIPGPKPIPIFGNVTRMAIGELTSKDILEFSKKINKKYGSIVRIENFLRGEDFVLLFDSSYNEQLLRNEGVWPIRDANPSVNYYKKVLRKDWFGENTGLPTEHGEKWYQFRTIVNPILMQPRVTQQYIASMDIIAQEFLTKMKQFSKNNKTHEMPEDFDNELNKWSLESISLITIDKHLGCLNADPDPNIQQFIHTVINFFDLLYKMDYKMSFWRWISTPNFRKFVKNHDSMSRFIMEHINDAILRIKNSPPKPETEQSVLEKLLNVNKQVAFNMAMDMMIAGVETTSKTTGAILYYLAKTPKAQDTLRKELCDLLPTKDAPITKKVLDNAQYLKAVIRETQRFAPAATMNLRKLTKDVVIGGYQIPKDINIMGCTLIMSLRDYPKPNKFIPERWLRSTKGELSHKNVNSFSSLPFGFGPRSCVGQRLAQLEMQILVARVVRNFKLEWHHKDMTFRQSLIYGYKDPLKLTAKEINI